MEYTTQSYVTDGVDIAKTHLGEQMSIDTKGRVMNQRIYAKTSTGKGYDAKTEAPDDEHPISLLATQAEIDSRKDTVQYLVVGIIIAKEPGRYATSGQGPSRNKGRDAERKSRGVLPREPNVLRALVPVTAHLDPTSTPLYRIAYGQENGICKVKPMVFENIFFFPEIWERVSAKNAKEKKTEIGQICKSLAADSQNPPERNVISIKKRRSNTNQPEREFTVSAQVNSANRLKLQHDVFMISKSAVALQALQETIRSILPDLRCKPNNAAILEFLQYEKALDAEETESLISAIQKTYPELPLMKKEVVNSLHQSLCRTGLGPKLPYKFLIQFLRFGHERVETRDMNDNSVDQVVESTLKDISIWAEMETLQRTPAKCVDQRRSLEFLGGICNELKDVVAFLERQAQALREQHGGLTMHKSVEELSAKIGQCAGAAALQLLEEQWFALHADQMAMSNQGGTNRIRELITIIERYITGCEHL
ncbi:hypothetical protein GLAREA_11203 [Glarea lozoyensis ATCC 20868]|uniref:Uncharacterized protein n=1 Tax=Glarea lozoyensis (strain ATCC 20868 / MF5171) TaxID=1116229 RepID=S3DEF7_GLAL2|nr:uncharacterized protein GLAREA_11203 [Glarea lozoyensis ATCC 20868]EPE35504.1 hypothetical protein GLAREA_11203 [Glarea lozoyensis ATCC 20868]